MKSTIKFFFLLLLTPTLLYSQSNSNDSTAKKSFVLGYNLGLPISILTPTSELPYKTSIDNKLGARLGVFAEYRFNSNVSVSTELALTSIDTRVHFTQLKDSVEVQRNYSVRPLVGDIMCHFKYIFPRSWVSPYILFGPNARIPVSNRSEASLNYGTAFDLALNVGLGIKQNFGDLQITPEIRYSRGLFDINMNPGMPPLYFHELSFVIGFSLNGESKE